jgi:hypothetical protein
VDSSRLPVGLIGRTRALAIVMLCSVLVAGCGSGSSAAEPGADASTIASTSFTCTLPALERQRQVRAAVGRQVADLQRRPQLTNDCDHGLDAGVEFHVSGSVARIVPAVTSSLSCTDPKFSRSALGRRTTLQCHVGDLWLRVTLDPYLPADAPKGPSVLGAAYLMEGPGGA